MGTVEHRDWTLADGVQHLGLHHLDAAHQQEVVRPIQADAVQVQTVCEACEEAVQMHPELLVEGHVIQ
jgi:hypothetical protein